MNLPHLRAWWAARQGLLSVAPDQTPSAVLTRSGWARSVGGINPYLTLFSRAGIPRAAAAHTIHELPCVRGCTYVVPADDFALAKRPRSIACAARSWAPSTAAPGTPPPSSRPSAMRPNTLSSRAAERAAVTRHRSWHPDDTRTQPVKL